MSNFKNEDPETVPANIQIDDPLFYSKLYHKLWRFASDKFELSGSAMSKDVLLSNMISAGLSPDIGSQFVEVIRQSELRMYTTVQDEEEKSKLLAQADELINTITQL